MRSLFWLLVCCAFPAASAAQPDDLTVYRCRNAKGELTLRDTPCLAGEQQQTQSMIRPRDPAPRPTTQAAAPVPTTAPMVQAVPTYLPLRTLYQCTAPDGSRYHSETAQGKLRWQPLWLGVPGYQAYPYPPVRIADGRASVEYQGRHGSVRLESGRQVLGHADVRIGHAYPLPGVGSWVHDSCIALTQAETCALLAEQRSQIRRRYPHAMPSERRELARESTLIEQHIQQCSR